MAHMKTWLNAPAIGDDRDPPLQLVLGLANFGCLGKCISSY